MRVIVQGRRKQLAWTIKDEGAAVGGAVFTTRQAAGSRSIFTARQTVPTFKPYRVRAAGQSVLSAASQEILRCCGKEWENGIEIARRSGVKTEARSRKQSTNCKEYQVILAKSFRTEIHLHLDPAESRFQDELTTKSAGKSTEEIARAYLVGAGMTSRVNWAGYGLSNRIRIGNWAR